MLKINIYAAILIIILLMLVMPTILLFALKKHQKALKITTIILSVIYFVLLFIGTTASFTIKNSEVYLTYKLGEWFKLRYLWFGFGKINVLINLILLFPVGFIVFLFANNKPFLKTIIICFSISLFIEIYQWVLPFNRTTELTNIVFNTLSGLISAIYCKVLKRFGAFKASENLTKK